MQTFDVYIANRFTSTLLNHLLSEMGLFTLHNYCDYLTVNVVFLFQSLMVLTFG